MRFGLPLQPSDLAQSRRLSDLGEIARDRRVATEVSITLIGLSGRVEHLAHMSIPTGIAPIRQNATVRQHLATSLRTEQFPMVLSTPFPAIQLTYTVIWTQIESVL